MSHLNLTKSCLQKYAVEPPRRNVSAIIIFGLLLITLIQKIEKNTNIYVEMNNNIKISMIVKILFFSKLTSLMLIKTFKVSIGT